MRQIPPQYKNIPNSLNTHQQQVVVINWETVVIVYK